MDLNKIRSFERRLANIVTAKYNKIFKDRRHNPSGFIAISLEGLAKKLDRQQYFFTDIMNEGIILSNNCNYILPEIKQLPYEKRRDIAQKEFNKCVQFADRRLYHGYIGYEKGWYKDGAFDAHQACENYYKSILSVFVNQNPKLHDLEKLITLTKSYSRELAVVFPQNSEFEKEAFKAIYEAYTRARYDDAYKVTKEQFEYMLREAEVLKEITYRICKNRIKHYDKKAKEEQ